MYAGSTLTPLSGRVLGAHQHIDRLAYRQLCRLLPRSRFPQVQQILSFEGRNGPDAIKRKSPGPDEPWHYLQPFDPADTRLIRLIEHHYRDLVKALRERDDVRAAFEAAWLSHAVVDGLTPAHQYPYEQKLTELRQDRGVQDRTTIGKKVIIPGPTRRSWLSNNWQFWGPRGLFTTHFMFEWGTAMLLAPMKARRWVLSPETIAEFESQPLGEWFRQVAQDVARLELYETFYRRGWTIPLARRIRRQLVPVLLQAVTLVWYGAAREAEAGGPAAGKAV